MKSSLKKLIYFFFVCISLSTFAQIPQGLNFQTIVRDNSGKPLATKNVNFRFSVLQGGTGGQVVYSEEHRAVSNEFGLVNLLIGYGFPLSGKFDQINWGAGSFFLKTEIDPNGGINYELSGVSPFLSVPYALYAGQTKLEAGPGIKIDGNKISNTGDPDPSDDLKIGSSVAGDLSGTLPNPKVTGLQNRAVMDVQPNTNQALVWNGSQWTPANVDSDPSNDLTIGTTTGGDLSGPLPNPKVVGLQNRAVMDIQPATNQALVWNGSQWIPANIDNDPGNDLLINSTAGGDLGGSYPNPKVQKLNGFPLASTNPDSGDVLVFSQGEWKHLPIGSNPTSGVWKRTANEVQLEDALNIQKVNVANAIVQTQNTFAAFKNTDSTSISSIGVQLKKGTGTTQNLMMITPDAFTIHSGQKYLYGHYAYLTGNIPYAESEYWNNDPNSPSIRSRLNAKELEFEGQNPERAGYYYGGGLYIEHKSKASPLEYSGVELRDSGLYFYNGPRDVLYMESTPQWGGEMFFYDKAGKGKLAISELTADQSQPYVGLFSTKTNREVVALNGYNSVGELTLYNSNTDEWILYAGYSSLGTAFPYIGISDGFGEDVAGFTLNNMGDGVMFADLKFFRMDDPEVDQQEIWYACVEGPEAAAYERGTGSLVNGEAYIKFSDHFRKVINPQSLTVQLTSLSASTYGLAVIEKNADGFKVKELQNGNGNFSFDWEIKGVRQGYEDYEVYRKKETLRSKDKAVGVKPPDNASNSFRNTRNRNK